MTSPDVLKLELIQALIEAIDLDDEEDAKQGVKLVRALLESSGKQG